MKTEQQINAEIDRLSAILNNEPDEFDDRDEEELWHGIRCQQDGLMFALDARAYMLTGCEDEQAPTCAHSLNHPPIDKRTTLNYCGTCKDWFCNTPDAIADTIKRADSHITQKVGK